MLHLEKAEILNRNFCFLSEFIVDRHGESQLVRVAGTVFSETIRNLHPATTYVFTVKAQNQVGESEQSEVRMFS